MNEMKACRLHAIGDLRCESMDIPVPHGTELLIRVGACGICGSDLPRAFVHGSSNGKYPLVIGHEFSGEVVAVGDDADPGLIGTKGAIYPLIPCRSCDACVTGNYAMCEDYDYLGSRRDGGFAEYCVIPSQWHLIPSKNASMEALAMTEPACVAQHAVRRSAVAFGQFLVIYGAGPIGIMAARWARLAGASVLLVDIADDKVAFAKSKGFDSVNSLTCDVPSYIRERNNGRLADCAIEGTGAGPALAGCVECVRACGNIALLGNPGRDTTIPIRIHSMMLRKEVNIHGVWNSSLSPIPIHEWRYTVEMMDSGAFQAEDLITDRFSLPQMPGIMEEIASGKRKIVKAMYVR